MGLTDMRLKKYGDLAATSRSIVLGKTEHLRDQNQGESFRKYRQAAEEKRKLELDWSQKVKVNFKTDSEKKREVALSAPSCLRCGGRASACDAEISAPLF